MQLQISSIQGVAQLEYDKRDELCNVLNANRKRSSKMVGEKISKTIFAVIATASL